MQLNACNARFSMHLGHSMTSELTILTHDGTVLPILAQPSRCAYTITFRKSYITSLEIWTIGLWIVGLLGCWVVGNLDDWTLDYWIIWLQFNSDGWLLFTITFSVKCLVFYTSTKWTLPLLGLHSFAIKNGQTVLCHSYAASKWLN